LINAENKANFEKGAKIPAATAHSGAVVQPSVFPG